MRHVYNIFQNSGYRQVLRRDTYSSMFLQQEYRCVKLKNDPNKSVSVFPLFKFIISSLVVLQIVSQFG